MKSNRFGLALCGLALAVAPAFAQDAAKDAKSNAQNANLVKMVPGQKAKVAGVIVKRDADNFIVRDLKGGDVTVELTKTAPDRVRLTVRDRGIGIPIGQQSRIFERFYQAHKNSHRSGLGLGLYLSQRIVAEHGGRLTAEQVADGGSRFVVELPSGSAAPDERPLPV